MKKKKYDRTHSYMANERKCIVRCFTQQPSTIYKTSETIMQNAFQKVNMKAKSSSTSNCATTITTGALLLLLLLLATKHHTQLNKKMQMHRNQLRFTAVNKCTTTKDEKKVFEKHKTGIFFHTHFVSNDKSETA